MVFHSDFVERVLILSFDIFGCSGGNLRHQNQHLLKRKMIKFSLSEKATKVFFDVTKVIIGGF